LKTACVLDHFDTCCFAHSVHWTTVQELFRKVVTNNYQLTCFQLG